MSITNAVNHKEDDGVLVISNVLRIQKERCGYCYETNQMSMKVCQTCRFMKYCSKKCQRTDWQRHRIECKDISQHDIVILELDDASTFPKQLAIDNRLPTFEIMNESLRRWVKFYDFVLMAATIHALDLPKDISRATTHALWLTLHHKGTPLSPPSKSFRVDDASVVAVSDIAEGEWSETLRLFSAMRDRSRAAEQGEVAMVIIECLPLGIQIVPVGSVLEGHLKGQVLLDWKDILIRCVENGEKVVQFGSDGCQGEGFRE